MAADTPLSRMEKLALKFGELANQDRRGKWLQNHFLRGVSYAWVRPAIANRILVEGLETLIAQTPSPPAPSGGPPASPATKASTGVMVVSNHRSFFDQYIQMLACFMGPVPWARRLYFPVRANFFYDSPAGIAVNAAIAGGAMYPPIYRQADRRVLNDEALDKMVDIVKQPGNVLGMHPEGTRGKGDDPYTLLPGQPGVGKLALVAQPMVIPAFQLGLGNNIAQDIAWNFGREARRQHAVIMVFGEPVDFRDLCAEKPRPTLYKKCADRFMAAIKGLGERERSLRADVLSGKIDDADSRWLANRSHPKFYASEA